MAEQDDNRTEQASARRKADARRQGQVAVSRDIPTAAMLFGAVAFLYLLAETAVGRIVNMMREWFARAADMNALAVLRIDRVHDIIHLSGWETLGLVLPFAVAVGAAGIAAYVVQTGALWTSEGLRFDGSRISPIGGLGKLLSFKSAGELVKAVIKLSVIGSVAVFTIRKDLSQLPELMHQELPVLLHTTGMLVFRLTMTIAFTIGLIAIADYAYQRFEWERSLKMSRQDLKQEHRDAEGDPVLRSRVRSLQKEMARNRMIAEVPTADVIVTNPTHLAVALRYDQHRMSAPIVVAKGAGFIAERIKEVAAEHGVMIVENKVVARTLYQLVEIGREVPEELYRAVAEILALVFRARGTRAL
jgi:flagellar biosynthesis protein FlhB